MAYNPFNIFRRNQKAIFAVITVFIMFTFVLSSGMGGGADFFDWLPNWIRGKTQKGDHLCTIDGSKVYTGDVDKVRRSRMLANRFMSLASAEAQENLLRYANELMGRISPERRRLFELAFQNPQLAMQIGMLLGPNAKTEEREAAQAIQMAMVFGEMRARSPDHYFLNAPNRNA